MIEFLTCTTEHLTEVSCVLHHTALSLRIEIKKALKILTKQNFYMYNKRKLLQILAVSEMRVSVLAFSSRFQYGHLHYRHSSSSSSISVSSTWSLGAGIAQSV